MPNNKSKGSKAERELYQMFVDNHFRAVRVAGSGTMENADCDLIAGKPGSKYCIEAKSTKQTSKYISKHQMNSFIVFSEIFGLTPVIGVRFNRIGWFFFDPKDLVDSGKNWAVSMELARSKGKRFSQFFGDDIGISSPEENKSGRKEFDDYEVLKEMDYIEESEDSEDKSYIEE